MGYIPGPDREQRVLVPERRDDSSDEANPVRVLEVLVNGLDFTALGLTHAPPTQTGRPADHPGDLLKLSLYGYVNKIRARRTLEHARQRNREVMWLLRQLTPEFKPLVAFRNENSHALKGVC